MNTNRHNPMSCPTCDYTMDASTCISDEEAVPKPGDVSFCFNCGEILEFSKDLTLVEITADTLLSMSYEERAKLLEIQAKILKFRGMQHLHENFD